MDFSVVLSFLAISLITLMVASPVLVWPLTRKLALPVLALFYLFVFLHWDFVTGLTDVAHDTKHNLESWSFITSQWVYSGAPFEWNPYWYGGQPFSIYNNIFSFIPSYFFALLFKTLGFDFERVQFFNLVFIFGFFNMCVGSLLLFRRICSNNFLVLIGFASLLFGGYLPAESVQAASLESLSFMPYLLFFVINFYHTKKPGNLLFFFLILGMSVNYYLPTYVGIEMGLFVAICILGCVFKNRFTRRNLFSCFKILMRPKLLVLCLVLFCLTAAPLLFSYVEMGDYVSPTRGFTERGEMGGVSYQQSVAADFKSYVFLFDSNLQSLTKSPGKVFLIKTHGTFYIGVLPCLGFLIAIFLGGIGLNWVFVVFSIFMVVLGAGHGTPVWAWVLENIPLANMTRHTFVFSRLAALMIVAGSILGQDFSKPGVLPTA